MQVTFTGQKLRTRFNVKDRTKLEHKHDIILENVQDGIVLY